VLNVSPAVKNKGVWATVSCAVSANCSYISLKRFVQKTKKVERS